MGQAGLEQPAESPVYPPIPVQSAAKSGAVSADPVQPDADLQWLNQLWPNLPEAVRARIVAMVKASG